MPSGLTKSDQQRSTGPVPVPRELGKPDHTMPHEQRCAPGKSIVGPTREGRAGGQTQEGGLELAVGRRFTDVDADAQQILEPDRTGGTATRRLLRRYTISSTQLRSG